MANAVDRNRVCEILGYTFINEGILTEALTSAHRIEIGNGAYQSLENNRRLAAMGQAVITLHLTEGWIDGPDPLSKTSNSQHYPALICIRQIEQHPGSSCIQSCPECCCCAVWYRQLHY